MWWLSTLSIIKRTKRFSVVIHVISHYMGIIKSQILLRFCKVFHQSETSPYICIREKVSIIVKLMTSGCNVQNTSNCIIWMWIIIILSTYHLDLLFCKVQIYTNSKNFDQTSTTVLMASTKNNQSLMPNTKMFVIVWYGSFWLTNSYTALHISIRVKYEIWACA